MSLESSVISIVLPLNAHEIIDVVLFDDPEVFKPTQVIEPSISNGASFNEATEASRPPSGNGRYLVFGDAERKQMEALEEDILGDGVRFRNSTEKKISTSLKFFQAFISHSFQNTAFSPVRGTALEDIFFQRMCIFALNSDLCAYSVEGFVNTYLPNLQLGLERQYGISLPKNFKKLAYGIVEKLKQKDLIDEVQFGGEGAHPLMYFDLEQIYKTMPNGWKFRYSLMAYLSTGLLCGGRGVTLCSLKWSDFTNVEVFTNPSTQTQVTQVSFTLRKTKGGSTILPITFEGEMLKEHASNAVYHLNMQCQAVFGVSLHDVKTLSPTQLSQNVFQASKPDQLSALLSNVSLYAGYPRGYFTLHSLRGGFLCGMTIYKYFSSSSEGVSVSSTMDSLLFLSGIIGGWTPGSKAQLVYLKSALKRVLVASRFSFSGWSTQSEPDQAYFSNLLGASIIAVNRLNPQHFHDLPNFSPNWSLSTQISAFGSLVKKYLPKVITSGRSQESILKHFNATTVSTTVWKDDEDMWDFHSADGSLPAAQILQHRLIDIAFEDSISQIPFGGFKSLISSMPTQSTLLALASKPRNEYKKPGKAVQKKKRKIIGFSPKKKETRKLTVAGTRKRVKWSASEDILLATLYLKHQNQQRPFPFISPSFATRTSGDCNDRFKTYKRKKEFKNMSTLEICDWILKNVQTAAKTNEDQ